MNSRRYRNCLFAAALVTCLFLVLRRDLSRTGISDAFALSGICFLIAALFLTARNLHSYDLIVYGFQKFTSLFKNRNFTRNSSLAYHEFLEGQTYSKHYMEYYFTAAVLIFCSAGINYL